MHTRRPSLVVVAALSAVFTIALAVSPSLLPPARAATARSRAVASAAVDWIISQQRDDGGFGSAEPGFAGFETPDAVLAIADGAQTETTYNRRAAFLAVNRVTRNGVSPFHYLDDLADDLASQPANARAGKAAQLVLVASAVGLAPAAFDPDGDGATDLVAAVDAGKQGNGSYGNLGGTLFVLLADQVLERTAPADTIAFVDGAQQANGGWGFAGDPSGSDEDVDTTSRAVQALIAAGKSPDDGSLTKALGLLARLQNDDGSWSAFGSPDANATAMGTLAITAAGYRVEDRCWRDSHATGIRTTYVSPDAYLRSQQDADNHIASGSDSYGVNTFATSQAVQALLRAFQPVARAVDQPCLTRGYRLVARDGGVFAFGGATFAGSAADIALAQPIVASVATPSGLGYWLFASDGGVFAFGDADFYGSTAALRLASPIVGAATTPDGGGYWLFARDGGVFAFGEAVFLGSAADSPLPGPVVAGAAATTGRGYVLFDALGTTRYFGDAIKRAPSSGVRPPRPVVAGALTATGKGHWLFTDDGGVFAVGDAPFAGSAADKQLRAPVVNGTRSREGGYYALGADGGLFAFGGAPFFGSTGDRQLNSPVVAVMA